MLNLANCESTFRPFVTNGPNIGLYQLASPGLLDTFYLKYDNAFDPSQQANFTAEQLAAHNTRPWPVCYPRAIRFY